MEQNMQSSENNPEIKLDGEGEPIHFSPKKNLSKKMVALVLSLVILIIVGVIYFMFFNKDNNDQIMPVENTEIMESKEVDKNLDSDQDKLPDYFEKILGTDENNPDTDGDNYSDFDEIKNGYNPLTDKKFTDEEWYNVKEKIKGEDEGFYEKEFGSVDINSGFTCGTSTVNDIDGNTYNTVSIGSQCWLKQNLKVTKNPAGIAITRYCYDNDVNICDTDGGLYDWNTAMNKSANEGAQGICPSGTHIPTDAEQYTLENYLKDGANSCVSARTGWDCSAAGTKLKVGGTSGFEGVLAGHRGAAGTFGNRLTYMYFWSSSQYDASDAWTRNLGSGSSTVYRDYFNRANAFSARCLKD